MRLRGNLSGKRLKGQGVPGVSLTPVDVRISLGESTTRGARNLVTDLNYQYTADANQNIWDAGGLMASGAAIRPLKAPSTSTFTVTIASPGVVTWNAHGLSNDDPVVLYTTGALPTGLTAGTRYWIVNSATNTFQLAATRGGSAINTSGSQSGTHTAVANGGHEQQPGGAAYVDTAYQATIGDAYEFSRIYRATSPGTRLDEFVFHRGGGRFSDANGTFGRAVNYKYDLTDGAYNEFKTQWAAYVAVLNAAGKTPNIILCDITLGGNTAGDATESGNFQTDLSNLISQLRTDVIGSAKVVLNRLSNQQTGTNATNRATIRAAMEAIALADPTRVEICDMDGMSAPIDGVHFNAPAHCLRGARLAQHALGLWYPAKPLQALSDPQYALREWLFNSQQNTVASGFLASIPDSIANASTLSSGAGARPTATTRTLANGLVARYGVYDGSSQVSIGSAPACIPASGGFILSGAVKSAAVFNGVLYAEGNSGASRVFGLKSDASGNGCLTVVDDAGTVVLSLAVVIPTLFDGSWHTFAIVWNESTVTGYKDGVAQTPVAWVRTTMNLNNCSVGAQSVNGSTGGFLPCSVGKLNVNKYSATNLSTVIANLHAHHNRYFI